MDVSLSLVTFLPLLGAVLLLLMPERLGGQIHRLGFLISLVTAALSLCFFFGFDEGTARLQFEESYSWIPSLGVNFHLGLDGISILLYVLTAVLTPLAILASVGSVNRRIKEFVSMLLVLESFMLGTLAAADVFVFYVFWELMLIPMALLIGVWGGPRRIYATVKFVLFTVAGSLPMLLAILYLYASYRSQGIGAEGVSGGFDFQSLAHLTLTEKEQTFLFLGFALSFVIKLPLFPVHTWLPDAHTEAPTAGSVVLAGVLLKMGGYGLLRYALPLFPLGAAKFTPFILVLCVIGIIHGALVALAQTDIKKLIAYSSVSHMGLVALGIFAANEMGIRGSIYQMLAHGLSTGALFLLVGVIYERRHTRELSEFGGIAKVMPWFAAVFLLTTFASVGLPGLCGFVGEFLVLLGVFAKSKVMAALAALGMILGAWYMLKLVKGVFYGELTNKENEGLPDLSAKEITVLVPLVLLMILAGVYPMPFLNKTDASVEALVRRINMEVPAEPDVSAFSDDQGNKIIVTGAKDDR